MMLIAGILALVAGGFLLWRSDWIMPGVQVFGIDLGQRTTTAATAALTAYWREQAITLDAGDEAWTVPPETLGITFDPEATDPNITRSRRRFFNVLR